MDGKEGLTDPRHDRRGELLEQQAKQTPPVERRQGTEGVRQIGNPEQRAVLAQQRFGRRRLDRQAKETIGAKGKGNLPEPDERQQPDPEQPGNRPDQHPFFHLAAPVIRLRSSSPTRFRICLRDNPARMSCVKAVRSGVRSFSSSLPAAVREVTTAPDPCRMESRPSPWSSRYAAATVFRFTPRSAATCRTGGSETPSVSSPRAMSALMASTTC